MDTTVVVAIVSGALGVAGTLGVPALNRHFVKEDARSEAQEVLDRYREPLVDAAWDLGDRIGNIVSGGYLSYLSDDRRGREVIDSTLFRVAQYCGWVELIRSELRFLHFEGSDDTRQTADLLAVVTRDFASDRFDPGHLMLWKEEQRAIGERMILRGEVTGCLGYAQFIDKYDEHFRRWFEYWPSELTHLSEWLRQHPDPSNVYERSPRLASLSRDLAELVQKLDEEKRYAVAPDTETWLTTALKMPSPWPADARTTAPAARTGA